MTPIERRRGDGGHERVPREAIVYSIANRILTSCLVAIIPASPGVSSQAHLDS
jgi:hypothetical protein